MDVPHVGSQGNTVQIIDFGGQNAAFQTGMNSLQFGLFAVHLFVNLNAFLPERRFHTVCPAGIFAGNGGNAAAETGNGLHLGKQSILGAL